MSQGMNSTVLGLTSDWGSVDVTMPATRSAELEKLEYVSNESH